MKMNYTRTTSKSMSIDDLMIRTYARMMELYSRFTVDFLCRRGTLRKIMSALFDFIVDWSIGVIRWRGCHCMFVFPTESEINIEHEHTSIDKHLQYWGHKFEDFLTFEQPSLTPSPKKIFSTMNQARLGRHTRLDSCEIDACTTTATFHIDSTRCTYVKVKTVHAKHLLDLKLTS
jgi:hypothetical protein